MGETSAGSRHGVRRGSVEMGLRRSEMKRHTYDAGEMSLIPRHLEKWFRNEDLHGLCIGISDAALAAASDGTSGEVELCRADKLVDSRLGALVEVVNAERASGFPSGRLFLDSIEQALAVVLVNGYALRHRSVQTHRGGLGSARLRRIKEFVHAKMEGELTLYEMAQCVELSTAHFSRMFRKSTGESPHHFVLRHRVEPRRKCCGRTRRVSWTSQWLRFQNAAALCTGVPPDVRSEPYRISPGISAVRSDSRFGEPL